MKIAVHGSYYGYNFGDTLLCRIFAGWAREAEGVDAVVLPQANERNRQLIGADQRGWLHTLGAAGCIFAGGGYFSEDPTAGKRWHARAFTRHMILAEFLQFKRVPIAILGVGVGPISDGFLRARIVRLFEGADEVVVRDEESKAYLQRWGDRRHIEVGTDAALSLTREMAGIDALEYPSQLPPAGSKKRSLLLHTSATPGNRELAVIREALRWSDSRNDVQVILATDSAPRRSRTLWPAEVGKAIGPANRPEYFYYDGEIEKLLNLLGKVDGVVTTKLHVGIVGTVLGTPVISVPQHAKTPRFYKQIGLSTQCIAPNDDWAAQLGSKLEDWHSGIRPDLSQMRLVSTKSVYKPTIERFARRLTPAGSQ